MSPSTSTDDLFLYESKGEAVPYVTLSHCWGQTDSIHSIQTERHNLRDHKKVIKFLSLPKTFQDAVTLCRELGIKYLWIDSLCIIQNDEADWVTESAKMGSIYE